MDTNANSQHGKIVGTVVDESGEESKRTRNPVAHARIEVFPKGRKGAAAQYEQVPLHSTYSDAAGNFEIDCVKPDTYEVRCHAFLLEPLCHTVTVPEGSAGRADFNLKLGFNVIALVAPGDCQPPVPCDRVTEGRSVLLRAGHERHIKPTTLHWSASGGRLEPASDDPRERLLLTEGAPGKILATLTMIDADNAILAAGIHVFVEEPFAQLIRGNIGITKKRTDVPPTDDIGLWSAIRNRTKAISFGGVGIKGSRGRGYQGFIDAVLCGGKVELPGGNVCGPTPNLGGLVARAQNLPMHGMAAYELLKTATEIFLLWNCGVAIRHHDATGSHLTSNTDEFSRIGLSVGEITDALGRYLGSGRLPYIERVVQTAFPGDIPSDSVFCTGVLSRRVDCPCLIELIWSYWHEEGMLAQTLNAVSRRFQNVHGPGDRDPLLHLDIDPLRPLNNLIWGYVQDEVNRLSVKRRGYEYDHVYGLPLYGKAMRRFRPADSRSKFLEGFNNLLHAAAAFYKEDNDTNYIAEGFPLLNALKEVHLLLAQGAGNQFADLSWTARVEMLIQQWLISRPEMREFLQSRAMVPYTEGWMPQVDTMKTLQGWTDVPVTHFHDLGTYGEQLLLSVRYGDWTEVNDENQAKNWARYWRPEIQGYLHAYRAATGVDLTNPDGADYTLPAVHLRKRLANQRVR